MRGWVVREFGQLEFDERLAAPELDPAQQHDVIVEVSAAAPNFADNLQINGEYQERPEPPFVPGMELAGVVEQTSSDLVSAGQRVVGVARPGSGAWAQQARCDARQLTVLPDAMPTLEALALHVNAQTAWFALYRQGRLLPGEVVLVNAAAGGVGSMAVQLAAADGHVVYATTSAAKRDIPVSLGAVACFDNRDPEWPSQLTDANGGEGVDLVVELVGGPVFAASWRLLRFEGRLVTVGFTSGELPAVKASHALVKNVSLVGVYWGRYAAERPDLTAAAAEAIWSTYLDGKLDPLITVRDSVTAADARVSAIAAGQTTGKTILTWD